MSWTPSFSSLGCAEATLDEVIGLARRYKFSCVELRALSGNLDLPAYLEKTYGSPAALSKTIASQPVSIAAFDTSFSLGKPGDNRDALLAFVPWAEALGLKWLRVFDGGKPNDATTLDTAVQSFTWWSEQRTKNGWTVDVMVESHDSLITTPAILEFCRACPQARLLWDTHHTWKKGGESPAATWSAIKRHVVHIHVKDSISKPSARHPFTYVLPGHGEFPAQELFAAIKSEFDGVVALEWERLWHPYLPPLTEALDAARDHSWW